LTSLPGTVLGPMCGISVATTNCDSTSTAISQCIAFAVAL
jgi:hypothetical protein